MIPLGVLASARVAGSSHLVSTYLGMADSTIDATTYAFTGVALGTADDSRRIVVAVGGRATAAVSIESVTIGGLSATIAGQHVYTSGGSTILGFAAASVPTGTAGDVVVTMSGAGTVRLGIDVWALTGAASAYEFTYSQGTSTLSADGTVPAGGAVLAALQSNGSGAAGAWVEPFVTHSARNLEGSSLLSSASSTESGEARMTGIAGSVVVLGLLAVAPAP